MGWSLDYFPIREPELLYEFLLAAGKALYLATAYEKKCRYVLRIAKLADHYDETGDASATMALAAVLKDRMLCATIYELKSFSEIRASDITLLEKAKDARNFIAHECANFAPLSSVSAKHIQEQLTRLRDKVTVLANGDNVVSCWVYVIEEKEAAPVEIQSSYVQRVRQWVFGDTDRT